MLEHLGTLRSSIGLMFLYKLAGSINKKIQAYLALFRAGFGMAQKTLKKHEVGDWGERGAGGLNEDRDMSGREWTHAVHLPPMSGRHMALEERDHRLCRGIGGLARSIYRGMAILTMKLFPRQTCYFFGQVLGEI